MPSVLKPHIRDPALLGFVDRELHRGDATDHPESRLAIDNPPRRSLPIDDRNGRRLVPPGLQLLQITDQELGAVGKDPKRIGGRQCVRAPLRVLRRHPGRNQSVDDELMKLLKSDSQSTDHRRSSFSFPQAAESFTR